jgi:two-component system OmpR family sensor kinase
MMSIRFRLTLLYSTILALTLVVFGVALYSIQARDTLNSLKRDLLTSNEKLVEATLRTDLSPPPQDTERQEPPPPKPFGEFSSEQAFQALPEREIVRVLDENGNLVASPFASAEDALPLSQDGLVALQNQQEWWESGSVSGEHMLIYNRPIVRHGQTVYIVQVARSLNERDRTLRSLATTLGGAGLLTILIAFGVGWVLSGTTLKPIHRITQTAQAIGDERDFTRRVAYDGPQDEVGQLANTFNQMLTRLQDAYQKVEHSLEMQRNFVADVSHELRTPLTTLRGNLGLLGRTPPAPPEEQADILADMVDESDRLIRLVNDLLLLARAGVGRSLDKALLTIQPVLEETVRQAHQLDLGRQITLDVSPGLTILGDRDAFKQIMLSLLDNALKHSDGEVNVEASRNGVQVEIRVQDHGAGIPPGKLAHVFDRFYRGDDSSVPGFGLGLPIAKTLTENMDGTITIESELDQGSVVTLRFSAPGQRT